MMAIAIELTAAVYITQQQRRWGYTVDRHRVLLEKLEYPSMFLAFFLSAMLPLNGFVDFG